jgi:hypothetical protein
MNKNLLTHETRIGEIRNDSFFDLEAKVFFTLRFGDGFGSGKFSVLHMAALLFKGQYLDSPFIGALLAGCAIWLRSYFCHSCMLAGRKGKKIGDEQQPPHTLLSFVASERTWTSIC